MSKEKVTFMPDYIEIFFQVYCSFKAYIWNRRPGYLPSLAYIKYINLA